LFSIKAGEKGIKLLVEIDGKLPRGLMLDEVRLRQVLFNVVGNAIKFTEKGQVVIRAGSTPGGSSRREEALTEPSLGGRAGSKFSVGGQADGPFPLTPAVSHEERENAPTVDGPTLAGTPAAEGEESLLTSAATRQEEETRVDLILEVSDTGIGIPEDQREHIFGAFSQVAGQSTRKFGGTGLGLTITKRLTEMMQGRIEVQSQLGQGSTFRMVFPKVELTELEGGRVAAGDGSGDFTQFAPAKILVADDVALNRALLAGFFEGTGHRLVTANNGREALEKAERERPDLILMDMRMPEIDGYQATERIKSNPELKHIPVIAVTASSFREEEARARKVCDGFIRKPIDRMELIAEMKRFLTAANVTKETAHSSLPVADSTAVSAEMRARRPELLAKLGHEQKEIWPRLCQTMDMGEIEEFALRLKNWADAGGFGSLRDYAVAMLQQVEAFDVDRLPATLQRFPEVCATAAETSVTAT
jgi:CheY-like chemotaxis protein